MRGNQNLYGDNKVIYMKVSGLKKGENPHFAQTVKNAEGKYDALPDEFAVSGHLIKAEISKYEWEGKEVLNIKLYLEDPAVKEICVVECGMNGIGRNIINSLANAPDFEEPFKFSLYTNKKGYQSIYILQDDTPSGWKYPVDVLKAKIVTSEVRKNGQIEVVNDYYDLDQWLLDVFKTEVIARVKPKKPTQSTSAPHEEFRETPLPEEAGSDVPSPQVTDDSSDLPF